MFASNYRKTTEYASVWVELVNDDDDHKDVELSFEFTGCFRTDATMTDPSEAGCDNKFLVGGFQELTELLMEGYESPECGSDYKSIIQYAEERAWANFEFDS